MASPYCGLFESNCCYLPERMLRQRGREPVSTKPVGSGGLTTSQVPCVQWTLESRILNRMQNISTEGYRSRRNCECRDLFRQPSPIAIPADGHPIRRRRSRHGFGRLGVCHGVCLSRICKACPCRVREHRSLLAQSGRGGQSLFPAGAGRVVPWQTGVECDGAERRRAHRPDDQATHAGAGSLSCAGLLPG